mmetsp:Transcript_29608/g.48855  ORF Transcript_29608/g.48855 Transcript_29608/m.48855 type:complete len:200 (-) Transcript_29608:340-939(-)
MNICVQSSLKTWIARHTSDIGCRDCIQQAVLLTILKHVRRKHLLQNRHGCLVHSKSLQNCIVVVYLKGHAEIKHYIRAIGAHLALNDRTRMRVDNDERQRNLFVFLRLAPAIVFHQVAKAHLLHQQLAKGLTLALHFLFPKLSLTFQHIQIVVSVRREALPGYFLLFLRDNIHGHKHIQSVIDAAPNILLVVLASRLSV